jgi:hypothetical protein
MVFELKSLKKNQHLKWALQATTPIFQPRTKIDDKLYDQLCIKYLIILEKFNNLNLI